MKFYVGAMSGTSCDGVDLVLVDLKSNIELVKTLFVAYPQSLKMKLLDFINNEAHTIQEFSRLDAELGQIYADAINQLLFESKQNNKNVLAIGLHGQTVFHEPNHPLANTIQIGSAARVAAKTEIMTINNFRQLDVCMGGQGAPLAPVIHQQYFAQDNQDVAVLNLGGIANITCLGADGSVVGFDTGPASCLMDEWINIQLQKPYDDQGNWAKKGQVDFGLLKHMLDEPYFKLNFPKSTGRELFNQQWLNRCLINFEVSEVDVQRTLLQLTVETIMMGLRQSGLKFSRVICCGGGAHNRFLMETLQEQLECQLLTGNEVGVDGDFVEAILMAWLAKQHVENVKLDWSAITGAKNSAVYGTAYFPPN